MIHEMRCFDSIHCRSDFEKVFEEEMKALRAQRDDVDDKIAEHFKEVVERG